MLQDHANLRVVQPALPKSLTQPNGVVSALLCLYAIGLTFGASYLAHLAVHQQWSWGLKAAFTVPLVFMSGWGLVVSAWLGHEGFHGSLARNKYYSEFAGILVSSYVVGFLNEGFAITHWDHHAFTNEEHDPDLHSFGRRKNFLSRLFLARIEADQIYLFNTLKLALGKKLGYRRSRPFTDAEIRTFAQLNILAQLGWAGAVIALFAYSPLTALVSFALPLLSAMLFSASQAYVLHAGTGYGNGRSVRSPSAWIFTVAYLGSNFHLEHHLYPTVPCWRLPAVHRYLMTRGFHQKYRLHVEPSFWGTFKYMTKTYRYDKPSRGGSFPQSASPS
jgi:beta-carotene hydroxylase